MRLYKYLYYRLYSWNLKAWGKKDSPEWNALIGVSFMMGINLSLFLIIIQLLFEIKIILSDNLPKKEIIVVALVILAINYFIFNYKKKYLLIIEKYNNESLKKKRINALLLWLYIILSFVVIGIVLELYKNYGLQITP